MNGLKTLLGGRGLLESPRWHADRLYISDWSAGEVLRVDLAGESEVIARVESLPLCTAWTPEGQLVIVSSPDGRLLRQQTEGSLVEHRDLGRPGWSDIVIDGRGNAYINGAGFNPMAGEEFRPGSVVLAGADGSVREVADDVAFPNGIAGARRLVRRRPQQAVRASRRRREGAANGRCRSRLLCLRSRRTRRHNSVRSRCRVARHVRDGASRYRSGAHRRR